ncbi:MAG: EAL domain-containing protein, partial [Rhodoferax sp.]
EAQELKALDYWRLTPEKYAESEALQLETIKRTGHFGPYEKEYIRKDGSLIPLSLSGVLITGQDDQPYIWCIVEDISERKQAATELRESEKSLNEAQTLAQIGSYITDLKTGVWKASPALEQIFGIDSSFVTNIENWGKLMAPGYEKKMLDYYQSVVHGDGKFNMDYEIIRPCDGQTRWVAALGQFIYDADGTPTFLKGTIQDITERKHSEEQIGEQRRFLDTVNDNVQANIYVKDEDGRYLYVNRAAATVFGRPIADILGKSDIEIHPPQTARKLMAFDSEVRLNGVRHAAEEMVPDESGAPRYYWSVKMPIAVLNHPHALIGFSTDITQRKVAEEAQRIASTAFESQQSTYITDANKVILRVNKAFTEVTGYTLQEAVGQTPALLKSGRQNAAFYTAMWDSIRRTGVWQGEIWNRRKNGTMYPEHLSISSVKNETGLVTHYVGTFSDLTSHKTAEEQSRVLAYTDTLTGLPNRVMLIVRMQQAVMAAEKQNYRGALLIIDLDHFKNINDSLGHDLGDEVLKCIAKRLSALVQREFDTVARLGADEFGVLLDHLSPDPQTALREAETMTHKILEALRQPYQIANALVSCTASIGITSLGEKQEQVLDSLKQAELAMFQAKSAGGNDLCFFDPQMQTVVDVRVTLEAGLREAILNKQFTLHYQAQLSDSEGIIGVEALLRWVDPKRGVVSPAEFIPLAEETGLILPIGTWVLETACQQLAVWARQPAMAHLSIAVNVSARQFRESGFVDQVLAALERSGANANRLKLEPTESVLITDVEDVIAKMTALRSHGVGFSIDDFGTGYSSLAYLKRLPLEKLKIDQGFVRDILTSPDDAAIARAVIAMATSMGLGVIAEGVETEAQRDLLASMGCHTYQGYLFSKPLPVQEFEKLMR